MPASSQPVSLIAQLVEHCTSIAEVTGLNHVQDWTFLSGVQFFRIQYMFLDVSYVHIHLFTLSTALVMQRRCWGSFNLMDFYFLRRQIKRGVNLNAVFLSLDMVLMKISRSRFKQSKNSMLIPWIYVVGCFVNFWVIFGYIWEEIVFLEGLEKLREINIEDDTVLLVYSEFWLNIYAYHRALFTTNLKILFFFAGIYYLKIRICS